MKTNSGLLSSIRLGFELVKRETELKLVFQLITKRNLEKKPSQLIFDLLADLIDPLASTNAN